MCIAHCTMHNSQCTMHKTYCTMHTAHCIVHTAQCTMHFLFLVWNSLWVPLISRLSVCPDYSVICLIFGAGVQFLYRKTLNGNIFAILHNNFELKTFFSSLWRDRPGHCISQLCNGTFLNYRSPKDKICCHGAGAYFSSGEEGDKKQLGCSLDTVCRSHRHRKQKAEQRTPNTEQRTENIEQRTWNTEQRTQNTDPRTLSVKVWPWKLICHNFCLSLEGIFFNTK